MAPTTPTPDAFVDIKSYFLHHMAKHLSHRPTDQLLQSPQSISFMFVSAHERLPFIYIYIEIWVSPLTC